jgi:hypothetical protein
MSAESELSAAFARDPYPQSWLVQGQQAKRRAAEVAIAIDGLADRAGSALGLTPDEVRSLVGLHCVIGSAHRPGCIDRVCAVANAYKHAGCCARAASGHASVAPPRSVMNSRRLICVAL